MQKMSFISDGYFMLVVDRDTGDFGLFRVPVSCFGSCRCVT